MSCDVDVAPSDLALGVGPRESSNRYKEDKTRGHVQEPRESEAHRVPRRSCGVTDEKMEQSRHKSENGLLVR